VRNRSDGSVEILAEGEPLALAALRQWCDRGPKGAHVEKVATLPAAASGEFRAFTVRD
ncbi:MAG: acylphosphatase, partial [Candidatus Eremiobacteraeota bacterium]|nr:acylphosphatase [Candidatus Eremiobacteraeota bacterium]